MLVVGKVRWANVVRPRVSNKGYRTRYQVEVILTKEQYLEIREVTKALNNGKCTSLKAPDNPETYDGKPEYMNTEYYLEVTRPVYSADENDEGIATAKLGVVGPNAVTEFTDLVGNGSTCAVKYYLKKTTYEGIKSIQARFTFDDPVVQVREHVAYQNESADSFEAVEGSEGEDSFEAVKGDHNTITRGIRVIDAEVVTEEEDEIWE